MLYQEEVELNGTTFIHHYSDTFWIKQLENNSEYIEAYDLTPKTYIETSRLLEKEDKQ